MSDAPSPLVQLLRTIEVASAVRRGLLAGVGLAIALYLIRVLELVGPVAGTRSYPVLGAAGWYALLALVLAVSLAMLVTAVIVTVRLVRLFRDAAAQEPSS
jgi:hypothetical protein